MDQVLNLFEKYPEVAIGLSLLFSIIIAIAGIIPSVFITAANIIFFGVIYGTILSLFGEIIGAWISFILYRKGFKSKFADQLLKFPKISKLVNAEGRDAFSLIFSLRLIPFVPSGLITFAAAIGKVSASVFIISSSLGKIPALLIEAYSVYQVTSLKWQGKLILAILAIALIIFIVRNRKQ